MCSADMAMEPHEQTDPDDNGPMDGSWNGHHVCKDYGHVMPYLEGESEAPACDQPVTNERRANHRGDKKGITHRRLDLFTRSEKRTSINQSVYIHPSIHAREKNMPSTLPR